VQDNKKSNFFLDFFNFFLDFIIYLFLRFRQIIFYLYAGFLFAMDMAEAFKDKLVQKMFWGRSQMYKTIFQFSVALVTIILGIGGITGRLDLFVIQSSASNYYPSELLGDYDYLNEKGSLYSIVANSLEREFEVEIYTVVEGDTLSSIAEKFGVSGDTVRWENNIVGDYLKIGQQLRILPINGVIYTVKQGDTIDKIANLYSANVQNIYDINWLESNDLTVGQVLLIPDGKKPQPKPVYKPVVATKPSPIYTNPGTFVGTGQFVRPCGCGRITQYYSAGHRGVDIAQAGGCQTLAVDGGVVIQARWAGRGGQQIMIDHGNGFISLYAHHSALYVKEGQTVTKGQPIGYMGCTGSCTGTHLHFGLSLNGVYINPLNYIAI